MCKNSWIYEVYRLPSEWFSVRCLRDAEAKADPPIYLHVSDLPTSQPEICGCPSKLNTAPGLGDPGRMSDAKVISVDLSCQFGVNTHGCRINYSLCQTFAMLSIIKHDFNAVQPDCAKKASHVSFGVD